MLIPQASAFIAFNMAGAGHSLDASNITSGTLANARYNLTFFDLRYLLAQGETRTMQTSGNLSGQYVFGDGSFLTGINATAYVYNVTNNFTTVYNITNDYNLTTVYNITNNLTNYVTNNFTYNFTTVNNFTIVNNFTQVFNITNNVTTAFNESFYDLRYLMGNSTLNASMLFGQFNMSLLNETWLNQTIDLRDNDSAYLTASSPLNFSMLADRANVAMRNESNDFGNNNLSTNGSIFIGKSNITFGWNGSAYMRQAGGVGALMYMDSANFPQILAGNRNMSGDFYIDAWNKKTIYLNALKLGRVEVGENFTATNVLPPLNNSGRIGSKDSQWLEIWSTYNIVNDTFHAGNPGYVIRDVETSSGLVRQFVPRAFLAECDAPEGENWSMGRCWHDVSEERFNDTSYVLFGYNGSILYTGELLTNSKGWKAASNKSAAKTLDSVKVKADGMIDHALLDASLQTDGHISIDKRIGLLEELVRQMAATLCADKHKEYCLT